jgi:hypothetical protein
MDADTSAKPGDEKKDAARPQTASERIAAVKAKAPATTSAAPATAPATAPAAATDAAIAAAAAKADDVAAAKAATVQSSDDEFTARVKKAQAVMDKDPLRAMEELGIPLKKAIEQAMGGKLDDTELTRVRAELDALKAKSAADTAAATAAANAATAQARHNATVAAIIEDKTYPAITSVAQVNAALEQARAANRILVSDLGRPLNDTEADRLVAHYLKKTNDGAAASAGNDTDSARNPLKHTGSAGNALKSGTVQPGSGARRTWQQIKEQARAKATAARR